MLRGFSFAQLGGGFFLPHAASIWIKKKGREAAIVPQLLSLCARVGEGKMA